VREPLRIVPFDPCWRAAFEMERARLADALGPLASSIDHHGSTSVPGLAAKPVIDIQISVRSLTPLAPYVAALARIGYVHKPHPDDAWCPYFRRPEAWPHTHHVHLVTSGGEPERRTIAFRDYLRDHLQAAREYEQLKRDLVRRCDAGEIESSDGYARAKTSLVTRLTDVALAAGYPHWAIDLPLVTPRLRLREFVTADFDAVHAFASDPDVTRHMFHGPRDEPDTGDYLQRTIAAQASHPRRVWELAIVQRDTDRLIGACDLTVEGTSEGDLGYILRRDAWNHGFATEAARAMVDAGFAQLRLDCIIATCEVGHPASARVLEKAGLRWVRTLERHREAQGRWWDLELFRVARTEWT
jgi:[ribosomal protein S5]-alanine N-acetyltransferase